jgi:dipeptidyl aminopeptidase/acylaminoacyl peptidase
MRHALALPAVLVAALAVSAAAQQKPAVTRADYGKWESLSVNPRTALSPDGAWVAYVINRGNDEDEVRFQKLATGEETTVALASSPVFSSDSRWAAYSIRQSEEDEERLRREREPIHNSLGLIDLASAETSVVEGVQTFAFSGDGRYLLMRRYRPAPPGQGNAGGTGRAGGAGGGSTGDPDADPVGVTAIVRDLAAGTDTPFGNVSGSAWEDSDEGHLLAMTISAEGRAGNGVHLYDPATSVLRVLDSANETYSGLGWREDARDLVVMRSLGDEARDGPTQVVLAWRGVGTPGESRLTFDPTETASFPDGMRTVTSRQLSWSDEGRMMFLGIAEWKDKPAPARGRGAGREGRGGGEAGGQDEDVPGRGGGPGRGAGPGDDPERDEPADVAVWHWKDTTVMAAQQNRLAADRRRNHLSVWHLDSGRFVRLGRSFDETVTPIDGRPLAYVEDTGPYAMARSIGRRSADLYLADLETGERTPLREGVYDGYAQVSPGGRYVIFVEDGHYWTLDVETKAVTNITRGIRTSFVDTESDSTGVPRPMFGTAGWLADDAAVLLYDKHDIWQVAIDDSSSTRLTDGAGEGLRHRLTRMDFDDPFVSPGPHVVSLFGLRSKQSGYGRITIGGEPGVERLVLRDASITSLGKAADAEVYGWVEQRHDDSPDLFIASSADLAGPKQVTTTNAFQDEHAWSRSEVIDYTSETGTALQGALYYPAGYEAGRRYPMIVYVYETLSDSVHRYVVPSETSYYNTSVFTANGYFVLQPDIVFRPKEPGLSVVESVRPAVERVVEMGLADEARVGSIGHSWGGFDTAFLATHTDTFAAAVAGAAITNLVSNYGNHHWNSGIAETDHIETGQQRMVVPLYEDLDAYIRNSAVFNVHNMTTPLMLMTGDEDGTVFWHQAVEMYNIARRAGKNVVMLVYDGEDHGLRERKNQIDYQTRILAWFGHYLKGDDAPAWIADGQSWLDRQAEVAAASGGGGR